MIEYVNLPIGKKVRSGKVKDIYEFEEIPAAELHIFTDRVSVYDRVLGTIKYKGQVLAKLTKYWFTETSDIVANHFMESVGTNAILVAKAKVIPVEVIVRGFMTGSTKTSIWTMYEAGDRCPYGYELPDGLQKNERLPHPIITPTTKTTLDDVPMDRNGPVTRGILSEADWNFITDISLKLFKHGQDIAAKHGLTLMDTKYEFGRFGDHESQDIILIDEVHTPDSSRYLHNAEHLDKEMVRLRLRELGYSKDNIPVALPDNLVRDASGKYIKLLSLLAKGYVEPYNHETTVNDILAHLSRSTR